MENDKDTSASPPGVYRVCFVCTGNICRSPMAEWVLRAKAAEAGLEGLVRVDSAGTGDWHVGDAADPRTVRVLAEHGYPSRHRARQFEPSDFGRRDLVVALDSGHRRTLRRWRERAAAGGAPALAELRLLREFDPAANPTVGTAGGPAGGTAGGAAADPARLDVPDPYYGSLAGFEDCLALVEAAMPGLILYIESALETRAL